MYKDLYSCTHTFLRYDAVKRPLEHPYSRPHRVVKRITNRVFTIDIDGRITNVTVDRFKPTFYTPKEQSAAPGAPTDPATPGPSSECGSQEDAVRSNLKTYPDASKTVQKVVFSKITFILNFGFKPILILSFVKTFISDFLSFAKTFISDF